MIYELDENSDEVDDDIETDEEAEEEEEEENSEEEEGTHDDDAEDRDEVEITMPADEVENVEPTWETSEAVNAIRRRNIVVVRSVDSSFNPYYLLCALNEVELLESNVKDDYGHLHVQGSSVINKHYLEEMQRKASSVLYYKDGQNVAIVSLFSIAGISPKLIKVLCKRRESRC